MALNDRADQVVKAFVRSDLPEDAEINDKFGKYLSGEMDLIQQVLADAQDSTPQVAEAAPSPLRRGMIRYAVSPWDPLGTGYQGYVVYDGSAWNKVLLAGSLTASDVTNVAAGNISSVTVQAALNELDTEKLAINHDNSMRGILGFQQQNVAATWVEGSQWSPFIYATGVGSESIGIVGKTKTAGAALTTVMELSDTVYFYDRQFPVYLQWSDGGATAGPSLVMQRNSASPAASDQIGDIRFEGKDSNANNTLYAQITGRIESPTDTSEQGSIGFYARNGGGSTTEEARIGYNGTTHGSPTGGMKGSGTINATGYYLNGTALVSGQAWTQLGSTATTSGTSVTITSSISSTFKDMVILVKAISTNAANTAPVLIFTNGSGNITTGYNVQSMNPLSAQFTPTNHITLGSAEADALIDATDTVSATIRITKVDPSNPVYAVEGMWWSTQYGTGMGLLRGYLDFTGVTGGAPTGLKVSTNAGTATFDAGSVYVAYFD